MAPRHTNTNQGEACGILPRSNWNGRWEFGMMEPGETDRLYGVHWRKGNPKGERQAKVSVPREGPHATGGEGGTLNRGCTRFQSKRAKERKPYRPFGGVGHRRRGSATRREGTSTWVGDKPGRTSERGTGRLRTHIRYDRPEGKGNGGECEKGFGGGGGGGRM